MQSRPSLLSVRRFAIASWLLLTVLGALNHTLLPGIVPRALSSVFPNLRYGYVMFNRNMPEVAVITYKSGDEYRHLSEWIRTPAPGYKDARASINLLLIPDYLNYLCARRGEEAEVRFQLFNVLASRVPAREESFFCRDGEIRAQ